MNNCTSKNSIATPKFCKVQCYIILFLIRLMIPFGSFSTENQKEGDLSLWYNQPAKDWITEALPIGNGYMGPMFGDYGAQVIMGDLFISVEHKHG